MNKRKSKIYLLQTGIILVILLSMTISCQLKHVFADTNEPKIENPRLNALIPSGRILILGDSDFITNGYPGDGSPDNPYRIENFDINTAEDIGITVTGTTKHFVISNCFIQAFLWGVYIHNLANGTAEVRGNTFGNHEFSIYIYEAHFSKIFNNTIEESGSGIVIGSSSSTLVINNICVGTGYGIDIGDSDHLLVIGNNCSKNGIGIYSTDSSDCDISLNLLQENTLYGIQISDLNSQNNSIHHNTFIDNNLGGFSQAYDGGTNTWYDTSTNEGNFWSDYQGFGVYITAGEASSYDSYPLQFPVFPQNIFGIPDTPNLSIIYPNPSTTGLINLKWDLIENATEYYVYRDTDYIWSINELSPINVSDFNYYSDSIVTDGFYFYTIVASNIFGNSSYSNCEYVEVRIPSLQSPELAIIIPNPTDIDSVSLVWDDIDSATEYYIYRSDTYIWSVEGLIPITMVGSNSFIDTLPDEGFYFYVIVANDGVRNSTHSNCEYIQYKLPSLQEFTIVSSLIFGTFVVLFVVMRTRKKRNELN